MSSLLRLLRDFCGLGSKWRWSFSVAATVRLGQSVWQFWKIERSNRSSPTTKHSRHRAAADEVSLRAILGRYGGDCALWSGSVSLFIPVPEKHQTRCVAGQSPLPEQDLHNSATASKAGDSTNCIFS